MAQIHPSSVVDSKAEIADDVQIGPFCIIGPDVKIGAGTVLMSSVSILGKTTIGCRNRIFHGAAIGCEPQDKKYAGEATSLIIGDDNVIRENCTFSIGTVQDEGITRVGSKNLFMANAHIAHDCRIGSNVILANNTAIAGHVHIEDYAIIGGQSGVHQFVHVGCHVMAGGGSGILRDVPPYVICSAYPAAPHGINLVGLHRLGYSSEKIQLLKDMYHAIYREGNLIADAIVEMEKIIERAPEDFRAELTHMKDFVAQSPRGIIR